MEMDPVKVFLRLRPSVDEIDAHSFVDFERSTNKMIVIDKSTFALEKAIFAFDHIFFSSTTQRSIFEIMVEDRLDKFINGYNCSLLAYGQSGSGKTYTMGLNDSLASTGMIGMSINSLVDKLKLDQDPKSPVLSISFIEIYNEKVYDLLSEKCHESIYRKGVAKFNGSKKFKITSLAEAQEILQQGNKNRHVRATILNSNSSRSHAILSLHLNTFTESGEETSSEMHFCDLAGSEGLRNTQHKGLAQQEGVNINQGLLSLGKVVQALSTGQKLVPYRDSVLTMVLQNSLNSNSYLTILGCISSAQKDKNETISTIRFSQSVKTLDNRNIPELNDFLKQKQRMQARTPLKPYMLPLSRNETFKTPGKTPFKMTAPKYTTTIKKQPNGGLSQSCLFNNPSTHSTHRKVLRPTEIASNPDMNYTYQSTTESIDNNTFSVLNISSSTEVGASTPAVSFSPLMRRIEMTIDKKFASFMDNLQSQSMSINQQFQNTMKRNLMANTVGEILSDTITLDNTADSSSEIQEDNSITSTVLRQPKRENIIPKKLETRRLDYGATRRSARRTMDVTYEVVDLDAPSKKANETLGPVRRSMRISIYKENNKIKVEKEKSKTKSEVNLPTKKTTKSDHNKFILDVLNNKHFKDLKQLPMVGQKTAYQIITYRAINGKFKKIDELKNLVAFQGVKSWEKFLKANLLK